MKTTDVQVDRVQRGGLENQTFLNTEVIRPTTPSSDNHTKNSLLSVEEWAFVKEVSDLFPDRTPSILNRFIRFEQIEPSARLREANIALKEELRRGFVQRIEQGVTPETSKDDIENIHEHSSNMRLILRRIFNAYKDHDIVKSIPCKDLKDTLRKSFRLAAVHDMPEALTSDFTPVDMEKITPATKRHLEALSSRILFEAYPRKRQMLERYEEKDLLKNERNIDHLNKVVDILEGGVDCLAMDVSDECFNEWMGTIERGLRKYQDLSLLFASKAFTELKKLRADMPELVQEYPDVQQRRVQIIDRVFKPA